jgi:hypothetical protein
MWRDDLKILFEGAGRLEKQDPPAEKFNIDQSSIGECFWRVSSLLFTMEDSGVWTLFAS